MRLALLLLSFLLAFDVFAQAAPQPQPQPPPRPYNGKMSEASVGLVEHKVGKMGFSANDPRYQATRGAAWGAIGTAATYVGTALIVGGVAAVSWPAVAVAAGVGALVGGSVSLADGALTRWMFGDDGKITASTEIDPRMFEPAAPSSSGRARCYTIYNQSASPWNGICAATPYGAAAEYFAYETERPPAGSTPQGFYVGYSSYPWVTVTYKYNSSDRTWTTTRQLQAVVSGSTPVSPTPPVAGSEPMHPNEAAAAISNADAARPLSDEMMAAIANAVWKAATEANTAALPYSPSNPITTADAAAYREANPAAWPTVGDFASAVAPEGATSVPVPAPTPIPGQEPAPTPTPGKGQEVDLGPDPNVPAPTLERIPTAQEIINPVAGLMPSLRNYVMPTSEGQCPRPSFSVFETQYTIEAHCELFDQNAAILQMAMTALFSILAVFIVLRA